MDKIKIERTWLQGSPVQVDNLMGNAFVGEAGAHEFLISGKDNAGNVVPITGTITGKFLSSTMTTFALSGYVAEGVASVTLPSECYGAPGQFVVSIFATNGSTTTCIYCGVGSIFRTSTAAIAYPTTTLPDLTLLINQLDDVIASFPADLTHLLGAIAPTFVDNLPFYAGQYVWNDQVLYRFTVDHPAGSWAGSADTVVAVVGTELNSTVRYTQQVLTDAQKTVARTNIDAADADDVTDLELTTVQVTPQTFDDNSKSQARSNIGAASSGDLSTLSTLVNNQGGYISDLNAVIGNVPTGETVEGQIGDLKSAIDVISETGELTIAGSLNAFINNGNAVYAAAYARAVYYPVTTEKIITITKTPDKTFAIGFTTYVPANGIAVYGYVNNATGGSIQANVPNGAKYLLVVYYNTNSGTIGEETALASLHAMGLYGALDNTKLTNGYKEYVQQSITIKSDKLTDATDLSQDSFSGFQTIIYPVSPGEKYLVSCYKTSATYPGCFFWSDSEYLSDYTIMQTGADFEVTVPENATKMIVNGRAAIQAIVIKKYVIVSDEAFWANYEIVKENAQNIANCSKPHLGVQKASDGKTRIFMDGYTDGVDLECLIQPKGGNSLPDIKGWFKCTNDTGLVLDKSNGTEVTLINSDTDFLSPSIVYAAENMDGDFPNLTAGKFTGGWHMYNNATSGSYTPTARNITYKVYCDGVEIDSGESARGSRVEVLIVNRLQASNTEKEDGTGREVVEQECRLIFSEGFKCRVEGKITALEDVLYNTYYGVSVLLMSGKPYYWVGCRTNRQPQIPKTEAARCGDKYCTCIKQIGDNNILTMGIDPTLDLGTLHANNSLHSSIAGSGKSYMVLILPSANGTEKLALSANDCVWWAGYYDWQAI